MGIEGTNESPGIARALPPPPPPPSAMFSGPVSQQPGTAGQVAPPVGSPLTGNQPTVQSTAGGAVSTMQGVDPALATTVAKAIALGLVQAPRSDADWATLMDNYSTSAGRNAVDLKIKEDESSSSAPQQQGPAVAPSGGGVASPQGLTAFLGAIRQHESGGNYQAYNSGGGASGAYQFIQSTWSNAASEAGYSQWAGKPAGEAPALVQDAVAAHMATQYFNKYGSWQDAAEAWYDPALVGQNVVPAPGAGNTETVAGYGAEIVKMMGQQPGLDASHPAAGATSNVVKIAQAQMGTPYVWGGEDPNAPGHPGAFDCSGLVQWVYGQAGEKLPRVAQAQYDATPKVASYANLQPGDLLFFGSGPKGIEHVGIYVGNGQMIDAPHTGADVRTDTVFGPNGQPLWGNYVGATRPADPTGTTTAPQNSKTAQNVDQSQQNYGSILEQVIGQMSRFVRENKQKQQNPAAQEMGQ